jgi:exopolysaccharide biosynthesis protein
MVRFFLILAAVAVLAPVAAADTTISHPWPGITLERDAWTDPPMHFYVVTVDLTNPQIKLKVSPGGTDPKMTPPWQTTLMPLSEIARRDGLCVAVNGNLFETRDYQYILGYKFFYFKGNWARVNGWAMSDGVPFWTAPKMIGFPSMVVHTGGRITFGDFDHLPADSWQVVSGFWKILTDGNITIGEDSLTGELGQPAPHSAVGLDRAGKTLFLFTVDGRRDDYSVGMGLHQIATNLQSRGAFNALVLDGGGSATIVMRDPHGSVNVLNRPSDGHDLPMDLSVERCVANALGVIVTPATRPSAP